MSKTYLTRANKELFTRKPDEAFESMAALTQHCRDHKEKSTDKWVPPALLKAVPIMDELILDVPGDVCRMSDWSFSQLCGLAKVSKDTVNRLSSDTAAKVLAETIPKTNKPVQFFVEDGRVRSLHGVSYTRLFNVEVLSMLAEFATDFGPPPVGLNGMTGLYAGEQDMFAFLIDPAGWVEINGENFAPGLFCWNSEVGKRSVGVSTFWFQAVCRNHIVWDATEVVEVTRKHTGKVGEALADIRKVVEALVAKRDARRDGFAATIRKAMETELGKDAEEVLKVLAREGISKALAKQALEMGRTQGRFTIFSVVDALTRMAGELTNAGDRLQADQDAARLLELVG